MQERWLLKPLPKHLPREEPELQGLLASSKGLAPNDQLSDEIPAKLYVVLQLTGIFGVIGYRPRLQQPNLPRRRVYQREKCKR